MDEKEFVKTLWDEFGDVPIDDNDCILVKWRSFNKGTDRFLIMKWFEDFFGISVAEDLMGQGSTSADEERTIDPAIKELFPDYARLEKGEWSDFGRILQTAGADKVEIGLYREDDSDPEISGTLTLQIFVNDDVVICEQMSNN